MSDHPAITDADRELASDLYDYAVAKGADGHDENDDMAERIASHRERAVKEALEAERLRDNRVYRAIKELLHASTPADRANLAAGLLVALDKLAENQTDHIADAGKMIAPRRLAPGETP